MKPKRNLLFPADLQDMRLQRCTLQQWLNEHKIGAIQGELDRYIDPPRKPKLQVPCGGNHDYHRGFVSPTMS